MSWRDRDYNDTQWHEPARMRGGIPRPPRFTLGLLILHAAAFALVAATHTPLERAAPTPYALTGDSANVLTVLLHPWASDRFFTLLFIVFATWTLGVLLETRLGWQKFLLLYVAGNLAAGMIYLAIARAVPELARNPLDEPLGALAAWCVAATLLLWHERTSFLVYILPFPRVVAIAAAVVIVFGLLPHGPLGSAAWLAAIAAGAGAGWLLHSTDLRGLWQPRRSAARTLRSHRPIRAIHDPAPEPVAPDIDDILAKISREGVASLTDDERRRLEDARQARLRGSIR